MNRFDFLSAATIGQYVPTGSFLHSLDPRAKLLSCTLLVAALVATASLTTAAAALLGVAAAIAWSRVPLGYAVRGLRPALPVLLFLAVLQIVFIPANDTGTRLARVWIVTITVRDLVAGTLTVLRFSALILLLSLFSFITSTRELTHGTELLLAPLGRIGFPAHELSLVLSIAVRFVPLLAMEAEHIAKAQASRGADFGGRRGGMLTRVRRVLPILLPLFLSALRRAETLILAMESRCYTGGAGRSRYIRFRFGVRDAAASLLGLATLAAVVVLNVYNPDRFVLSWAGYP